MTEYQAVRLTIIQLARERHARSLQYHNCIIGCSLLVSRMDELADMYQLESAGLNIDLCSASAGSSST